MPKPEFNAHFVFANPLHFIAAGFGSGLLPKAPGTWGTLAAIPLYLVLQSLPVLTYLAITALGFLLGIVICDYTSQSLGVHDHKGIVWDEIIGYWLTMAFCPAQWCFIVLGFVLFRCFDIIKPWPIRWFDRHVAGGLGIMLDDLVAGAFAAIVLYVLQKLQQFLA